MTPPFRLIVKLFRSRFFENDTVSPGGGFQTNIYQLMGVLITLGGVLGYGVIAALLGAQGAGPDERWVFRGLLLLLPAHSFAVAGFVALFHWDMLFPDRRDFLILAPFPIRLREVIGAKFLALGSFVLVLLIASDLPADLLVALASQSAAFHGRAMRLVTAQFTATSGASLFGFLAVIAFQALLISALPIKIFRRISPWVQMLSMSLMVLSLLGFPIYSALLRRGIEERQLWVYMFPPVWFEGIYDLLLGEHNQLLSSLGILG